MKATIYYAGFIPSDGAYAVLFPDLPGCNSQGDTLEEAFAMSIDALEGHIEAMADDGDSIPSPSSQKEVMEKLVLQYKEFGLGDLPKETVLFPVKAPTLDIRTKQIAISLSKYKLDMIDRKAHALGMTRSGFLAVSANAYDIKQYA